MLCSCWGRRDRTGTRRGRNTAIDGMSSWPSASSLIITIHSYVIRHVGVVAAVVLIYSRPLIFTTGCFHLFILSLLSCLPLRLCRLFFPPFPPFSSHSLSLFHPPYNTVRYHTEKKRKREKEGPYMVYLRKMSTPSSSNLFF